VFKKLKRIDIRRPVVIIVCADRLGALPILLLFLFLFLLLLLLLLAI